MPRFTTKPLPDDYDVLAPDGSEVRVLLGLDGGGMAHFRLPAGTVSRAVTHRGVEEIWYVLAPGEMWRAQDGVAEITALEPGMCLTIPRGTAFQFRAGPVTAFAAIGVTMPPWPGADEAVFVEGAWPATS